MEVLKNVLLNWVLPVVAALAVYVVVQHVRAPEVATDAQGHAPAFTLMNIVCTCVCVCFVESALRVRF